MKNDYTLSDLSEDLRRDFPEEEAFSRTEFFEEIARTESEKVNLAVRILTGTGSWFSSVFILGWLFMIFDLDNYEESWLFIGLFLTGTSLIISRFAKLNYFSEVFLISVSFAGQALASFGIYEFFHESEAFFLTAAGLQALIFIFTGSHLQRFISAIAFNGFCAGLFYRMKLIGVGLPMLTFF